MTTKIEDFSVDLGGGKIMHSKRAVGYSIIDPSFHCIKVIWRDDCNVTLGRKWSFLIGVFVFIPLFVLIFFGK